MADVILSPIVRLMLSCLLLYSTPDVILSPIGQRIISCLLLDCGCYLVSYCTEDYILTPIGLRIISCLLLDGGCYLVSHWLAAELSLSLPTVGLGGYYSVGYGLPTIIVIISLGKPSFQCFLLNVKRFLDNKL